MGEARAMSAGELAARLGGALCGEAARMVRGVGTLEQAGPEMLTWVGAAEVLPRLAGSRAGVVLLPAGCAAPPERTCIRVEDPDLAICDVLRWLGPEAVRVAAGVHASAVVAADAVVAGAAIGPHVVVGPRAVVGPGTQLHAGVFVGAESRIGRDSVLWPNVVVRERVTIGERVVVHANATIGADGFGYVQRGGRNVKIPQIGTVVVEDDVEIGANTCIDRAKTGVTRIGRGTKIDNLCQIAHNVVIGENSIIVAQCGISGSTALGRNVLLAGQVGLVDHLRIGDSVQVTAKSMLTRSVPDGKVYRGIPAREYQEYMRNQAAAHKLPKLMDRVRELERRIERLESAADD